MQDITPETLSIAEETDLESTQDSSLPNSEEGISLQDSDMDPVDTLRIYKEGCLNCAHLVAHGQKTYSKCHYTNGNYLCPAQGIKIVAVGRVLKFAEAISNARLTRDAKREGALLSKLAAEPQAVQEQVYLTLENPAEVN